MAEQVQSVVIKMAIRDEVSAAAAKIAASIKEVANQTKAANSSSSGGGLFGGFGVPAAVLAAITATVAAMKNAVDLAKQAEINTARLGIALDGNLSTIKSTKDAIAEISKNSVFGQTDLTGVSEQLLERGVPQDQLLKTLQVVVNTASALRLPLDEVAEQIAQSYGGVLPKSLARAVPAIHQLSTAAMESGGVVDLLAEKFDGFGAKFLDTDAGQIEAAQKDIKQGWEDIGKSLLPLESETLPRIAALMKEISDFAGRKNGYGASDVADQILHAAADAAGVDINSTTDDLQKAANRDALGTGSADLDARAADARSRMMKLVEDINAIKQKGIDEAGKRAVEAAAKEADEEFKAREISVNEYIEKLDQSAAAERTRLASLSEQQQTSWKQLENDIQNQLTIQQGLADKLAIDPTNQSLVDASHLSQIQLEKDLERELLLRQSILKTQADISDQDHAALNERVKAIQEATKALQTTGTSGVKSVEDLHLTPAQLNQQIQEQTAQITAALPATFNLADKLFSPDDAAALKLRLQTALADARDQAQHAADSVTPLIGDLQAIGAEARKAATDGLANGLTEVETKAKSVRQALQEMLQTFVKSMLTIINQRLAENAANALLGPSNASGGSPVTGGLLGGLGAGLGALFGSLAGGGAAGFTPADNAAGGGIGSQESDLYSPSGGGLGLPGLAGGGYAGDGHPSQPAGIVHKGEYVFDAATTRAAGGRAAMDRLSARMSRGDFRPNVSTVLSDIRSGGGMNVGGGGNREMASAVHQMKDAISDFTANGGIHIVPAIHVSAKDFDDILANPGSIANLAKHMTRNPEVMGPALQKLGPRR